MSTKITPSQIKKIIKEELENILLEKISSVEDAIAFFKKWARSAGRASSVDAMDALRMLSQKTDLTARDLADARRVLNNVKDADPRKEPLEAIYKELSDKVGLGKAADDVAPVVPISTSGGSNLGVKAAGAGAVAAGAALMSQDPEDTVKNTDAAQLQSFQPEVFANFPEDELMSLPPEKQKIVKKKIESAKARRTRIAHATIKAKNVKESVISFQSRLDALGYDLGEYGVDGDYGPATLGAVRDFQEANGLTGDQADGIVGKNTWKILNSKNAKGPGKGSAKAVKSSTGIKHPSVSSAVSDSRWDDLFNSYVRAKNNVAKAMMRQGRKSFLGSDESASKMRVLQNTVYRKVRQSGLPDLASSGRRPVGGDKKSAAMKAAALLDKMFNEPSYFVQKLDDGDFLNDPNIVKSAAKQAIRSILDVKPVNEWKEFSKFSKLWE
jgi:hypothetical protein